MAEVIGYIPILEPMQVFHEWWYLLVVPLSLGISVIYKALRMRDLSGFWREVAVMTTQIVLAMIALAALLLVLVQVVIPLLPVQG